MHFLLDENSTNTIENARNCKRIVDHHGISTLKIVTNEFHMPRAHMIFKTVFRDSPVRLLPLHAPNGLAFDAQYRYRKYNVIIEKNAFVISLVFALTGRCAIDPLIRMSGL